jgi:hypothetical protein
MSLATRIEKHSPNSFGFSCCAVTRHLDGTLTRCGSLTHELLIIGANGVSIPYCADHMPRLTDKIGWLDNPKAEQN